MECGKFIFTDGRKRERKEDKLRKIYNKVRKVPSRNDGVKRGLKSFFDFIKIHSFKVIRELLFAVRYRIIAISHNLINLLLWPLTVPKRSFVAQLMTQRGRPIRREIDLAPNV